MDKEEENAAERLAIYELLIEMADRVSQRRQAANNFYLTVNTVLAGGSAYLGIQNPSALHLVVLAVAGITICALWLWNIESYRTLNTAKFAVITDLEKQLSIQPFTDEWSELEGDEKGNRHRPFHAVERLVPWVFIGVYVVQASIEIPWHRLCG